MQDIDNEYQPQAITEDFQRASTQPIETIPREKKSSGKMAWAAVAVIVAALIVAVAIIQAAYVRSNGPVPELPTPRAVSDTVLPSPTDLSKSFREISKVVKPAVVYIESTSTARGQDQPDFFGLPQRRASSAGSGFIVHPDGYILTNNHVVENSTRLEVTLSDNRKVPARVIGTDKETDIALIKVEASGLPVAVLGNSDQVEQGDWVLALGSPFGFQQTLTAGIVSATGREFSRSQFNKYIQTDASINPGNSGGPLINMQGEVIGINTMIIAEPGLAGFGGGGGNVGIGFAIASNTARQVFDQLVRNGKMSRGYLGVQVVPLDSAKASALGLEPEQGVLVQDVPDPSMPAGKAGIRSGDVITAFDGHSVRQPRELTNAVASTPVGKSVKIDFIRDGQPQSVTVELAERPDLDQVATRPGPQPQSPSGAEAGKLGIAAQTITPEKAEGMNLRISSGALVLEVKPGSPAAEAGIRHGDVIHRVGRTEVKTVEDLAAASSALKEGEQVAIQVERNGQMSFITVTID
jgi:serine protease Do